MRGFTYSSIRLLRQGTRMDFKRSIWLAIPGSTLREKRKVQDAAT